MPSVDLFFYANHQNIFVVFGKTPSSTWVASTERNYFTTGFLVKNRSGLPGDTLDALDARWQN